MAKISPMLEKSILNGSTTFLLALVLLVCLRPGQSFAEEVQAVGDVTVTTTIRRPDFECSLGATDKCKIGKPCFLGIAIEGEAAKQLYEVLKVKGVKDGGDAMGEYVGTQTDNLICVDYGEKTYHCFINYDAVDNTLTEAPYCEPE